MELVPAVAFDPDQAGALEHVEMLGDRLAARVDPVLHQQAATKLEQGLTVAFGQLVACRGQALAGVAYRRRQKKYESPQSTPVAAAQPHASGPSPTER